jgi:hypothetical protein
LSGNSVFQVTPHTSLKLCGRITKFPQSDLNRQVIRFARHAIEWRISDQFDTLLITG